jgi:2-polyprenyl-3-methyl-5-hydroxy-6-metoxy-1,4-benzoquinol methylase
MHTDKTKINEASVLKTFQQEIPSIYYSDKSAKEYETFKKNAENYYRDALKFPKELFKGKELIDFGAGTGENSVYLAEWGAKCTLVEMNDKAQKISKEIFSKYTKNYQDHKFILSSIFEFDKPEFYNKFDIVHCRGVLSHTTENKKAFNIISKYLKPGGYLIFGDPNKAGGFQNMLQRLIVYQFAKKWDEMIKVSEDLFSDDIDRAVKYGNRTRNCIIFDRWVVECQDDPSVEDILLWFKNNDLKFYSSQPKFSLPYGGDSQHHEPKFFVENQGEKAHSISELLWMTHTDEDKDVIPAMLNSVEPFAKEFSQLSSMLSNINPNSKLDFNLIKDKLETTNINLKKVDTLNIIKNKTDEMFKEVIQLLYIINIVIY